MDDRRETPPNPPPSESAAPPELPWERPYKDLLAEITRDHAAFERELSAVSSDAEKLGKYREQKAKLDAKIRELENKGKRDRRKRDTRRKILAGVYLLALVESGRYPLEQFQEGIRGYLTRPQDFALFGLEPPPPPTDD